MADQDVDVSDVFADLLDQRLVIDRMEQDFLRLHIQLKPVDAKERDLRLTSKIPVKV